MPFCRQEEKEEEIIRRLSCQRRSKRRIRQRESRATSHLPGRRDRGGPRPSVFLGSARKTEGEGRVQKIRIGLPSFALSFDSSSVKRRGRRSRRSRRRKALSVCRSESEISRAIVQIERASERERAERGRKSSVIGGSYVAARLLRVLLLRSSRPIDGVRMKRRRRKKTNMELSLDVLWPKQKRLCF